jgi:hypothetical protein
MQMYLHPSSLFGLSSQACSYSEFASEATALTGGRPVLWPLIAQENTTQLKHRYTPIPRTGFESRIERSKSVRALDRATTVAFKFHLYTCIKLIIKILSLGRRCV